MVLLSVLASLVALRVGARPARGGPPPTARLNINTAAGSELELLPGVGPARARAIIAARAGAPLRGIEDLARVPGFDEELIGRLRPLVVVRDEE